MQGDAVAEGFELADVVALLAFWVGMGVVVAGVEVVKLDGLVAQQVPDDDQDGTTYRDDGFLLAAAAGDAPVAFAQERVGPANSKMNGERACDSVPAERSGVGTGL